MLPLFEIAGTLSTHLRTPWTMQNCQDLLGHFYFNALLDFHNTSRESGKSKNLDLPDFRKADFYYISSKMMKWYNKTNCFLLNIKSKFSNFKRNCLSIFNNHI